MAGDTVITIIGNLTADPELRWTQSGAAVADFTVASTPRTFDRNAGDVRRTLREQKIRSGTIRKSGTSTRRPTFHVAERRRPTRRTQTRPRLKRRPTTRRPTSPQRHTTTHTKALLLTCRTV